MLELKLLVCLCLATPCILAFSCLEPENGVDVGEPRELAAFQQASNEDTGVKINWSPVWEDVDGSNELVSRTDKREKNKCEAPNGLGLQNLNQQIEKLLPKEKILKIVESYMEDPEVKALEAFVRNPETIEKIKAIENSREFQLLKDYSCHILHLNFETYHNIAQNAINPSSTRADNSERKGIKGLLIALDSVLPKHEIYEIFQKLIKTDDELVKAVAHLKSDEFHQLLMNVKNVPEYLELRKQLVALGMPVDEMYDILAKALGWSNSVNVLF